MKKPLLLFFAVLSFLLVFAENNVMELTGKRIIIPPLVKIQRGSFYTADVLKKLKFDEKYEYNELVFGDTLTVTDVQHLNKDDKKNEMILIQLIHNNKPIVLYLPLYIRNDDKRIYRNFYGKGERVAEFFSVNEKIPFDKVRLCYYDADLINRINSEWLNRLVYPRETEFAKIYGKYKLETERMSQFAPFIFCGFEFLDTEERNGNFEMLNAVFSNKQGVKYYLPINAANIDEHSYGHQLHNLTNAFFSEAELQAYCEQNSDSVLIDMVKQHYVGSEVFIDESKLDKRKTERAYNTAYYGETLKDWGDGYFHITGVKMLPSHSNRPYFNYFAIASNGSCEFAIPIDKDFSDIVVSASTHREELAEETSRIERERLEREAEWARQERQEQAALARKYGSANAKLISEGSIRLGFTKAMVRESWGSPYDTMTVANNYGTVECWIYGLGTYVYFRGNKVVQIID